MDDLLNQTPFISLLLPEELRSLLKEPLGTLLKTNEKSPEEQVKKQLNDIKKLICVVGDVVTDSLLKVGLVPHIVIIDRKTLRGSYSGTLPSSSEIIKVCNPPATITRESWIEIRKLYQSFITSEKDNKIDSNSTSEKNQKFILHVDGEEDLLVIPCIIEAPIGSFILYGQPHEGIVIVEVTQPIKDKMLTLLRRFELSVQS